MSWNPSTDVFGQGQLLPGDIALSSEFSSNRFAFYDPEKISVEYSRNGGESWIDYELSNTNKFNLTTNKNGYQIYLGKWTSGETFDPSWQLKITFNNLIGNQEIYGRIRLILINGSTNGSSNPKILLNGYNHAGNKTVYIDSVYRGWSGWNSYYPSNLTFGGWDSTSTTQIHKLEFIFSTDSYSGSSAPSIYNIFSYGDTLWDWKNNLVKWGHLYSVNENKSACFPSSLYVNNVMSTANKLLSSSEVDSKIEESWTWGEYD